MSSVDSILAENALVVFVSGGCPYCTQAEDALNQAGIPVRSRALSLSIHLPALSLNLSSTTNTHLPAPHTLSPPTPHTVPTVSPPRTSHLLARLPTHRTAPDRLTLPPFSPPPSRTPVSHTRQRAVQKGRGVARAAGRAEEQDGQDECPELLGQGGVRGRLQRRAGGVDGDQVGAHLVRLFAGSSLFSPHPIHSIRAICTCTVVANNSTSLRLSPSLLSATSHRTPHPARRIPHP